jgi:hypothetical protein
VNWTVVWFPATSAAVQVTVVEPIGNSDPDAGRQPPDATPDPPGSDAVTL